MVEPTESWLSDCIRLAKAGCTTTKPSNHELVYLCKYWTASRLSGFFLSIWYFGKERLTQLVSYPIATPSQSCSFIFLLWNWNRLRGHILCAKRTTMGQRALTSEMPSLTFTSSRLQSNCQLWSWSRDWTFGHCIETHYKCVETSRLFLRGLSTVLPPWTREWQRSFTIIDSVKG